MTKFQLLIRGPPNRIHLGRLETNFTFQVSPTCCLLKDPQWQWGRRSPRRQSHELSCCGTATSGREKQRRCLAKVTVIEKQEKGKQNWEWQKGTTRTMRRSRQTKKPSHWSWKKKRQIWEFLTRYGLGAFPLVLVCQRLKPPSASTIPN